MRLILLAVTAVLVAGCGMMGSMKDMAGQAMESGKDSAMSGKMAKDIGKGEDPAGMQQKQQKYKKMIDGYIAKVDSRALGSNKTQKCSYYHSASQRNGKSIEMNQALPQLFAYCYLNGQYTEIYAYDSQVKFKGATMVQRADQYLAKKFDNNADMFAVSMDMVVVFDQVNDKTKMMRKTLEE
ncbi:MAG: hypothetical protein HRT45_07440 [Bdellovibrionales bacterium]|nr:hypothetical protein [Bdellovibrionales bacterium]